MKNRKVSCEIGVLINVCVYTIILSTKYTIHSEYTLSTSRLLSFRRELKNKKICFSPINRYKMMQYAAMLYIKRENKNEINVSVRNLLLDVSQVA